MSKCSNGACKRRAKAEGLEAPEAAGEVIVYKDGSKRCGAGCCALRESNPELFETTQEKPAFQTKVDTKIEEGLKGEVVATITTTEVPADPTEFLKERGFPIQDYSIGKVEVSSWTTPMKVNDVPSLITNFRTFVGLTPKTLDPVKFGIATYDFTPPKSTYSVGQSAKGLETVFVIPDLHFGHRLVNGVKLNTHDDRALSVVLQLLNFVNPDRIVLLGDTMDFPEIGRHPHGYDLKGHIQSSIHLANRFLYQIRQITDCPVDILSGNHDDKRLCGYIRDSVAAIMTIPGVEVKIPSIGELIGADKLTMTYRGGPTQEGVDGYSLGTGYFNHRDFLYLHGYKSGKTAITDTMNTYHSSICMGHIHKQIMVSRMIPVPSNDGTIYYRRIHGISPGFLGMPDPILPGMSPERDYQQGISLVRHVLNDSNETSRTFVEQICVDHGVASYAGQIFTGVV